jgi:transposase
MDPLDLYHASRDELIDLVLAQRDRLADQEHLIARQQAEVADLRATIGQVTRQVGELRAALAAASGPDAGEPPGPPRPHGMPGLKPGPAPARPARPARRPRAQGFARQRMPPTAQAVHALAQCPRCGVPLVGGTVVHRREVIEVPLAPVTVTEHIWLARRCPCCHQTRRPPVDLTGLVDGRSRLGVRLMSLIATLREVGRLPIAVIRHLLATLYGLSLSVGGIVGVLRRVAARAGPLLDEIRAAIRASPAAYVDETGWREDGQNGYAWTASTPTARAFVRGSRAKAMLEQVLGAGFAGVLVSDFYGAYTSYEGRHQYCWAHLLRDIHDLTEQHPTDAGVQGWAAAVRDLYGRATAAAPAPGQRAHQQRAYERELLALCQPYLADPAAPQAGLCRRIATYLSELFVFVADPRVAPTNNAAERSLRHLVTCRKISGGTRSPAGSATKMALASLFGTWHVRGLNPFTECCRLLATPPPSQV